ncbi:MAG: hypothetical protein WC095_00870 [Candidatus Paceibacterota bacterium]
MKKILYRLVLSIFVFCGVFSFASAQSNPATNFTGTPYVWGNPIINADGSVSAAMPNGWGSFGADPFDTWAGTNVDNGQKWTINNRWLSDFGGRKIAELLGLNVKIYNTPGSCPLQEIAAGRVTNVICGSNSGRNVPPGSWTLYDGRNNNTAVTLEAFADWFLIGRDDIAKYAFENLWNPKFECYGGLNTIRYMMTYRLGIDGTVNLNMPLDEIKKNVENSSCQTSTSQTPTTQPITNTGSTGGSSTTNSSVGSDTPVNLARKLVDSLFDDFNKSMGSIGSIGLNTNTGTQTTTGGTSASSGTNSACYVFNSDLKLGSTGLDVTNLTARLVAEGLLSSQSNSFDQTVFAGVVAYQEKYTSQILTPVNLTQGTGYFGKSTRDYMNSKCTSTTNTGSTSVNTGSTGVVFTPQVYTPLVFEKPLASKVPAYSTSCALWTSPTGVTQQDSKFYLGSVLRSASQGEYYRGFWYDSPEVTYVGGVATAPTPIYFGNIGFNPYEKTSGINSEDNLLLKKGDTWILTDQKISKVGHEKVLSLLGVSLTAQPGEATDLKDIRAYNPASFYGNAYTWGMAQRFMRCEDEFARFLFINRNSEEVGKYYGYAVNSGYNSPESFMSNVNTIKKSEGVTITSTGTTQTSTTGSTQKVALTAKQVQDIQSQITVLLSQVSLLQEQLNQLK